MKGIIFNMFEEFVLDNFDREKYEEIESKATLKTQEPFVGPGTYPDEDLIALIDTATEILNISAHDVIKTFGKYMFPKLVEKYPLFTETFTHPKSFLQTIDSVIHVEVKKLYMNAETPDFQYDDPAPDKLIMRYKSKRKMCALVEGLLDGVSEHFNVPLEYIQTKCALSDGDICEFEIKF